MVYTHIIDAQSHFLIEESHLCHPYRQGGPHSYCGEDTRKKVFIKFLFQGRDMWIDIHNLYWKRNMDKQLGISKHTACPQFFKTPKGPCGHTV
jgi:hypothetical protein